MGLHLMPYGPQDNNQTQVAAGTLELLGQKAIVARANELDLADDRITSQSVWNQPDNAELEDAVAAVKDARIIIMNPPFTKMRDGATGQQLLDSLSTMAAELPKPDDAGESQPSPTGSVRVVCSIGIVAA